MGADLEARCGACLVAAECGHADTCRVLVEANADFERRGCSGETPLWMAAQAGHQPVVHMLANLRASIETVAMGDTPLTVACWKGHDVARYLVRTGAALEPDVVEGDRWPERSARDAGHRGLAEYIRAARR